VKYQAGQRLIDLLMAADENSIRDMLLLNELSLVPEDLEAILGSSHLAAYSLDLLSPMARRIRGSICAAREAGITHPIFDPLGEVIRAWKLVLDRRFDRVREEVDRVVKKWFRSVS